jgi:glycosyltransferase involved in cell wall biosynthesis
MRDRAIFLSPESPEPGAGGGGWRSASLLAYLRQHYDVTVARFDLPHHSKSPLARVWRNGWRFMRGIPPLFDRFSGFEDQLEPLLRDQHYKIGVIEHFWCAPYARTLRPNCDRLILDLHNVESQLARSHAAATHGIDSIAMSRFADAYERLELEWLREFDEILVASEEDRGRIDHPQITVYPNALPEIALPSVQEENCIAFSGNLEYHPNVEAVRWFHDRVWPLIRERDPSLEWRLIGCNQHAVRRSVAGDDRIKMTGRIEDAITALAAAKVCVVPLHSGSGTRFKILEAWAAGRAVVSTTIGAEGLGAEHGRHLLIADGPRDFGEQVNRLLGDDTLRRSLGEAGRKLYLDRFTWPTAWEAMS